MEKLLTGGRFFTSPLDTKGRRQFLEIFLEYRKNFPLKPTRNLSLAEKLPSYLYQTFRISRWFQLANDSEIAREQSGQPKVLEQKEFVKRYEQAIEVISSELKNRPMIWCHGHFKPKEIYAESGGAKYYLTDFAHTKMYPEGYELAFIIWADHFINADWQLDYNDWRSDVVDWLADLHLVADQLAIKNFNQLMRVSLVERILGTILADITASARDFQEKKKRLHLMYLLLDETLRGDLI
ncbi:MAG: hypothetical protein Q8P20_09240 [bacterium]|nr:hypothetical protein [bacterium]